MEIHYDDRALIYGCESWFWGLWHFDYFWVLSRTPTMNDKDKKDLIKKISEYVPDYKNAEYIKN